MAVLQRRTHVAPEPLCATGRTHQPDMQQADRANSTCRGLACWWRLHCLHIDCRRLHSLDGTGAEHVMGLETIGRAANRGFAAATSNLNRCRYSRQGFPCRASARCWDGGVDRRPLAGVVGTTRRPGRPVIIRAEPDGTEGYSGSGTELRSWDAGAVAAVAAAVALAVATALTVGRAPLEDVLYGDGLSTGVATLGGGSVVAAGLWSVALYFCSTQVVVEHSRATNQERWRGSPLQLLLLFLGRIETERPSDWLLRLLAKGAGLEPQASDYEPPAALQAAAIAFFALCGSSLAFALDSSLGDASWSVSTGLGACMAAGAYELGRPRRLNRKEAEELEAQWQDFRMFADARLQPRGRCHETEVFDAFRRQYSRYRSQERLPNWQIRDMVRNWHPRVERTASGYLKNVSLQSSIDPFTGEPSGSPP